MFCGRIETLRQGSTKFPVLLTIGTRFSSVQVSLAYVWDIPADCDPNVVYNFYLCKMNKILKQNIEIVIAFVFCLFVCVFLKRVLDLLGLEVTVVVNCHRSAGN